MAEREAGAAPWNAAFAAMAAAVALAAARAGQLAWKVDGIPSFDAADYMNRAAWYLAAAVEDGVAGYLDAASTPDVHPPGYPMALGAVYAFTGVSIPAACALSVALNVGSVLAFVLLGRRAGGRAGALGGLAGGLVLLASTEHVRLFAAPMSEPLGLLLTCAALGAGGWAIRSRSVGVSLLTGLLVAAASLVRYNLAAMLLVPLLGAHVLPGIREPRRLLDWRPLAWVVPTAAVFGTWWALRPGIARTIEFFLVNVDSGIPTWSAANLRWLPEELATGYLGSWPPVACALCLFALGLGQSVAAAVGRDRRCDPVEVAAHLFAAVGLAALWLHPHKIGRAAHPVAGILFWSAALTAARLVSVRAGLSCYLRKSPHGARTPRRGSRGLPEVVAGWKGGPGGRPSGFPPPGMRAKPALRRAALGSASLIVLGAWSGVRLNRLGDPAALGRPELVNVEEIDEAWHEVARLAEGRRRAAVSGVHHLISVPAIELALRLGSPGIHVVTDPRLPPACAQDPDPGRCLPRHSLALLAEGGPEADWLVVALRTVPRTRKGAAESVPDPYLPAWGALQEGAESAGVPALLRVEGRRAGVSLVAFGHPAD